MTEQVRDYHADGSWTGRPMTPDEARAEWLLSYTRRIVCEMVAKGWAPPEGWTAEDTGLLGGEPQ